MICFIIVNTKTTKGGGVNNDNSRHLNVSNTGQNQAIRADDDAPATAQQPRNSANSNGECANVLQHGAQESDEIASFVSSLSEGEETRLVHFLVEERHWAGLLPEPATFNQYSDEVKKSILSWNDATIIGGSERENKLVDSFVHHRKWAQIFSFLINAGIPIVGMIAFIITNDHACLTSLGVPVISIGVNVWKDKQDDQEKD